MNLNPTDNCINIPFSKTKLIIQLILSVVFGAAGVYFVLNAGAIANSGSHHRFVLEIVVIGFICLAFSAGGIVAFVNQLFLGKNGLQIDENGITIPAMFTKSYVTWGEISSFEIKEVSQSKLINIYLTDPYGYSQRQEGIFKRRLLLLFYKIYGTPLSITTGNLKCSFDELYALLNGKLDTYRGFWKV